MTSTVKLFKPDASSFSHEGVEYQADEQGVIELPAEAAAIAREFGFADAPEKAPSKKAR